MKRYLPYIIFVVVFLIVAATAFYFFRPGVELPKEPESQAETKTSQEERREKQAALIDFLKDLFDQESPGTALSLGVYDLENDEYFGYDDETPKHAASVSKVLTAVVLLDKIETGEIKLSDPMGAYNVEFQLEKMINISNQDSWDLIDAKLGLAPQEEFAKTRLNLTSVDMNQNLMSVKDVTLLLKALAKGEILRESSRDRLFGYMQGTESEDFFSPAFEQAAVNYYHKTGKYESEGHDAAIVEHEKYPFVLVVFSENNTNPNLIGRGTIMSTTASEVLDYFDSLE